MKTFVFNYSKFFILLAVAGGSVLFSAYGPAGDSNNPCYQGGTVQWDGYRCVCRMGFTGACCEIEQATETTLEIRHAGCSFTGPFIYSPKHYSCTMTIDGGIEAEAKLGRIMKVKANGDGTLTVNFENFAYWCIKGALLDKCVSKDCSTALSEILNN